MTTLPRISALELHKLILAGLVKSRIDAVPVIKKKNTRGGGGRPTLKNTGNQTARHNGNTTNA